MPRIRVIGGTVDRAPFVLVLVLEESVFSCPVRESFWVQIVSSVISSREHGTALSRDEDDDEDEDEND